MKIENYKLIILLALVFALSINTAYSQTTDELRQNIQNHNDKIRQLEAEIKAYEGQIQKTSAEAQTLQGAIKVLDLNQKKVGAEIKKTETNITKTNLTIKNLSGEIGDIEEKIKANSAAIAKSLSSMQQQDDESLIESFLTNKSLADILDEYETLNQFQKQVQNQSLELETYKKELSDKKAVSEKEKSKLVSLKTELSDQNKILDSNKKEKNVLLTATKNKESEYKKILAERQAEKERFEKELYQFESDLKRAIDPNSFPSSGKGIFAWPLDNIFITQHFGKTIDAKRLYTSGTHNGIDFRASRGTPVKAVLSGTVSGSGNTDEQRGCYSYGKWILIEHANGLSTLYAHLDLIKVVSGQKVSTGEIIGYSGNTGFSTGPHLHLTVYASQGVDIQKYSSSRNCKNVTIPVASINAYLDPMLYF